MGAGCPLASTKGEKATGDTMLNIDLAAFPHFAYIVFYTNSCVGATERQRDRKAHLHKSKPAANFEPFEGVKACSDSFLNLSTVFNSPGMVEALGERVWRIGWRRGDARGTEDLILGAKGTSARSLAPSARWKPSPIYWNLRIDAKKKYL